MSPLVTGVLQRAIDFVLKTLLPEAAGALGGPLGAILKAALDTDYAKGLEDTVSAKLGQLTSDELGKIETECLSWAGAFVKAHPEFQAFVNAVKPPPAVQFNLTTAQEQAIVQALTDGTLNAKLGLQ